ncbi:hypothetical protein TrLO_g3428 [Triparma laevis f. longispina]|uniref:Uncharacterized protein n=1 Tax=Triparma laevis f. longispina TaxID=1714387 RepID=A0A9W7CJR9_9STRA|nr:hypothetical protein TrLO_g3428 [Triparma laevis f. longispina]
MGTDTPAAMILRMKIVLDIISFCLDMAQIRTTTVCTILEGFDCDGTFYPDQTGWNVERLANSKPLFDGWFKTGTDTCNVRDDTAMGEVDHGELGILDVPRGMALLVLSIIGFVLLIINALNLSGVFTGGIDPTVLIWLCFALTLAEAIDQYFILNLTYSGILDAFSFAFSSFGLIIICCSMAMNADTGKRAMLGFIALDFGSMKLYVGTMAIYYKESGLEGEEVKHYVGLGATLIFVNFFCFCGACVSSNLLSTMTTCVENLGVLPQGTGAGFAMVEVASSI